MLIRAAVIASLISTIAIAAPAKPVKVLPMKPVHVGPDDGNGRRIDSFRVIAATPVLTAQINRALAESAETRGWLAASVANRKSGSHSCEAIFNTSILVSWRCGGAEESGGVSYGFSARAQFAIDAANKLVPLTEAMVFVPGVTIAKLGAVKGTSSYGDCTLPATIGDWLATSEGLEVLDDNPDTRHGCVFAWDDLKGKLLKDSVVARVLAAFPSDLSPEWESTATWAAAPRFVAEADDTVRDKATGLVWTGHDSGADLTYAAALALAKAKGAGWRLPTEAELSDLVDPELAHREPKDCTKGKSDLLITPAIHLSCGLVWGESVDDKRSIGMGFISGTPRISKQTETKNYRALLVKKG